MPQRLGQKLHQILIALGVEIMLLHALYGDGLGKGIIRLIFIHHGRKEGEGQIVGLIITILAAWAYADSRFCRAIGLGYETH